MQTLCIEVRIARTLHHYFGTSESQINQETSYQVDHNHLSLCFGMFRGFIPVFRYSNCFSDNALSIMKLGMENMVLKGEWVVLFFYGKMEKNHCVHASSCDGICSLSDRVFL